MRAIALAKKENISMHLIHVAVVALMLGALSGCSWFGRDEERTLPEGAVLEGGRRAPAFNPGGSGAPSSMDASQQSPQQLAQMQQEQSSGMFGWLPEWMGGDPSEPPMNAPYQSAAAPSRAPETDPFAPRFSPSAPVNSGGYPQLGATPPNPDRARFADNGQDMAAMQQMQSQAYASRQSLMNEPSDFAAVPPAAPYANAQAAPAMAYGQLPTYAGPGMNAAQASPLPPEAAAMLNPSAGPAMPAPAPQQVIAQVPQQSGGMFGFLPEWMGGDAYEAPPADVAAMRPETAQADPAMNMSALAPAAGAPRAPAANPGVVPYNDPSQMAASDEIIRLRPPGEWNMASNASGAEVPAAGGMAAPAASGQLKYFSDSRYSSRRAAR